MAVDTSTVTSGISTLVIGLLSTAILICAYTWISTSIFFRRDIQRFREKSKKDDNSVPPLLPYAVPALGSTITFSNQRIGDFFENLRSLSRKYGGLTAFSIMLSGTRTHFIFSAQGIASVFKARQLSRDQLDQQLGTNGYVPHREHHHPQHSLALRSGSSKEAAGWPRKSNDSVNTLSTK